MGTPQRKRNRQKKAKLKAGSKEEPGYDSTMKREQQATDQDGGRPPC